MFLQEFPVTYSVVTSNCTTHNASADSTCCAWGQGKQTLLCFFYDHFNIFTAVQSSADCRSDAASGHLSSLTTSAASGGLTPRPFLETSNIFWTFKQRVKKCSCQTREHRLFLFLWKDFSGTTLISSPTQKSSRSFISFFILRFIGRSHRLMCVRLLHRLTDRPTQCCEGSITASLSVCASDAKAATTGINGLSWGGQEAWIEGWTWRTKSRVGRVGLPRLYFIYDKWFLCCMICLFRCLVSLAQVIFCYTSFYPSIHPLLLNVCEDTHGGEWDKKRDTGLSQTTSIMTLHRHLVSQRILKP